MSSGKRRNRLTAVKAFLKIFAQKLVSKPLDSFSTERIDQDQL